MRFAPSAILSILASRRLLQLVDVLINSIVSTVLQNNIKKCEHGVRLEDLIPFCIQ